MVNKIKTPVAPRETWTDQVAQKEHSRKTEIALDNV